MCTIKFTIECLKKEERAEKGNFEFSRNLQDKY